MKPAIVLVVTFAIALGVLKIIYDEFEYALAGRIGMAAMMLFTAIAHFVFVKGMIMMVPEFIPFKRAVVYLTGVFEIASAPGLLYPPTQVLTGWLLIIFFILMLPANIQAAREKIDYQKGNNNGPGLSYLRLRVPLQLLFIGWTYFAAIH